MKNFILVIYALPGGGKGTQGKILENKLGANYLCSGDVIRQILKENSPLGKKVKTRYDQGIPQPDEVILEIFTNYILNIAKATDNDRFVIDGFPKTIKQAEALEKISDRLGLPKPFFIFLDVDPKSAIKRISNRLFCQMCGSSYLPSHPEYLAKSCFKCQNTIAIRSDDKPSVVRKRVEDEMIRIQILLNFYKKQNRLISVDGNPSIETVSKSIFESLKKIGITSQ